jgi:hypothetical protein
MKKQVKKRVLAKETLRKLELTALERVAGGSVGSDCQSDPVYNSCGRYCQREPFTRTDC